MNNIPWCEKYRPNNFDKIIFNNTNKILFENMIKLNKLSNILLYGPPGTGKTTTIINFINKYQEIYEIQNKSSIIHLNASDERGIDIIRNNIYNFINSKGLTKNKYKFIILDEVDYMTRTAQQGLKYLIQENHEKVLYILICNYISKIDYSLQNEFLKIRFFQLPKKDTINFLKNINNNENLNINEKFLNNIVSYFDNDIRSMINFIQSNLHKKLKILDDIVLEKLYNINKKKKINIFYNFIKKIEEDYGLNDRYLLKSYINYIILNKNLINYNYLYDYEFIIHNLDIVDILIETVYYLVKEST
jgi:DNA polymerase III delta prime subunit